MIGVLDQIGLANARFETDSIEVMKQLVLRGLGVACATRLGWSNEIALGRLVHVPLHYAGAHIYGELGLYVRKDKPLSAASEIFARSLGKVIASLGDE